MDGIFHVNLWIIHSISNVLKEIPNSLNIRVSIWIVLLQFPLRLFELHLLFMFFCSLHQQYPSFVHFVKITLASDASIALKSRRKSKVIDKFVLFALQCTDIDTNALRAAKEATLFALTHTILLTKEKVFVTQTAIIISLLVDIFMNVLEGVLVGTVGLFKLIDTRREIRCSKRVLID